ncbi:hypothetical protein [Cytobacillus praedii]|uniref:Uncharacterized protein n=1 Tax=Cytobacillus praedii TaxID=1742358 RepID=A0A4R1B1W8_9BACI|nr:hypothetical protein [Cytobacillus praedii]TCJ04876.1 hypothetical protein E0Y62_06550 [Cytobacillus praedii]
MSAQAVFDKMKSFYLATGKVMQQEEFISNIGKLYKTEQIIEGLMVFNHYLDERPSKKNAQNSIKIINPGGHSIAKYH